MKKNFLLIALCAIVLSGCADIQPSIKDCVTGHEYGFWGGLWHGIIAPFSFIGSMFNDSIDVFAKNNNGGWYDFGFLWGVGALIGGGSKASK